jgi:TonB family protein
MATTERERSCLNKIASYVLSFSLLLLFFLGASEELTARQVPKAYAYVSADYIITAEIAGPRSFVINLINLSDYVIVLQPNEFIYKGSSGSFYIGQVFEGEHRDGRGMTFRYRASTLLGSRTFTGLTLVGLFGEQDAIEEMSLRVGSKRFYLVPLDRIDFEMLAAKIAELDLETIDPRAALAQANLSSLGRMTRTDGTSAWSQDWEGLITVDGVNPPKIIQSTPVAPTEEALRTKTFGKVQLSATINKNGGVQDLMVVRGLGRGLDARALGAVRNSWLFLPATRNGEVVQTTIKFEVPFTPPEQH